MSAFRHPARVRIFRRIARPTFRMLIRILMKLELSGLAHVPREGAYLVVSNHLSLYEPPLLLALWPTMLEVVAAMDVFERPYQSSLVRAYGAIPVHRNAVDRSVLAAMMAALESGRPVLIFPEGGRSHQPGLRKGHSGAAYVAARAKVPILPVGITGTEIARDAWRRCRRPRIRVRIGELFTLPEIDLRSPERREALKRNTETIMRAIAALLPEPYRGLYGESA